MSYYFKYTTEQLCELKTKDETLANLIDKIGMIKRETNPYTFDELMRSMVAQQISTKAAVTVSKRLKDKIGLSAENLANANVEYIQSCGMSMIKASNIQAIAKAHLEGSIHINDYENMTDNEIIQDLTKLRGVGEWTAEMLLLFSLNRYDILSYNDLVIRKSLCRLYGLEKITKKEFKYYKDLFSPYGSIASLYLWEYNKYED